MRFWIARDEDNSLWMFENKPKYSEGVKCFGCKIGEKFSEIDCSWFPEVTFKNSPQEVELKLAEEIVGIAESHSKTFSKVNDFEVGVSYRR